jgi:hypothetical protein
VPGIYVSRRGHVGVGFGCLGSLFFLFFYLLYGMLLLGLIALGIGVFVLALLIAYAGVGVDALLMHYREPYRAKRVGRGPLRWPEAVTVGTSAFWISATKRGRRR